jgi:hypothetical protein
MNTSIAPFETKDFGKQLIQSALNFFDVMRKDAVLRRQYHEELCFDMGLDSDTVRRTNGFLCTHPWGICFVLGECSQNAQLSARFPRPIPNRTSGSYAGFGRTSNIGAWNPQHRRTTLPYISECRGARMSETVRYSRLLPKSAAASCSKLPDRTTPAKRSRTSVWSLCFNNKLSQHPCALVAPNDVHLLEWERIE